MEKPNFYNEVYRVVRKIPKGKVTTYGTIAILLGRPRAARAVGYALNAIKKNDGSHSIPWQRVINAKGQISHRGDSPRAILQRKILVAEGIVFDKLESVDLKKYGWINP